MEAPTLTIADLNSHNHEDDCWIAVHSKVWDVTDFLKIHPGGPNIILKYAGTDATAAYEEIHAPGMFEENLPTEKYMGNLVASADVPAMPENEPTQQQIRPQRDNIPQPSTQQLPIIPEIYEKPHLHSLISAHDFHDVAEKTLTTKAWAFYSSAATDLVTHGMNKSLLRRIMIRPRILRDVRDIRMKRKILGYESSAPFFISPAAMAKLVCKDGELALARGAGEQGIIQCVSSNASYPLPSIMDAAKSPEQPFFLQLYVNSDRPKTVELLQKAKALGLKAIFVTVDAPVPGKREADERVAAEAVSSAISGAVATNDKKGGGMGRLMAQYIDKSLKWEDIKWIKEVSGLPIVLKGVQNAADAVMAVKYGVEGIMLSNHGGRSLDTAQPAILVLLELHRICPEIFDNLEVYIDGGFERGSDILKALALGVTAVGIGRPYMYSLNYGQEGVEHLTEILKDELENSMRLCGITDVDQAHPGILNTQDVDYLVRSGNEHPYVRWKPKARL